MERRTIKLLHQESLTAVEELLLVLGGEKDDISLKGDMNLCLMLPTGHNAETVKWEPVIKVQVIQGHPLSFI